MDLGLLNLKTLEILRYEDDWVEIDVGIIDVIATLIRKGYTTEYCCEGHWRDNEVLVYDEDGNEIPVPSNLITCCYEESYISFAVGVELPSIPDGWGLEDPHDDAGVTIRAGEDSASEEEFEKKKAECLRSLRAWAEGLPEYKKG